MTLDSSSAPSDRVSKANLLTHPLEKLLPRLTKYNFNGQRFRVESKKSCELLESEKKWCFDLLKANMKAIYEKSRSGWKEADKEKEMFESGAYYLLVTETTSQSSKPVGYCHFRFDMDFDNEVIYCYELQVELEYRKFGLGSFLMEILEKLCEKLELEKVMLTCSKHNTIGQRFFRDKLKYELDETDLNEENPDVDYCIYSKVFWEECDEE